MPESWLHRINVIIRIDMIFCARPVNDTVNTILLTTPKALAISAPLLKHYRSPF